MKKLMVLLVLMLVPAFAQSVQVTAGSPFSLNAGIKMALVPFLLDGRAYAGVNFLTGGSTALGGGVDVLMSVPLTDVYAGAGIFYSTGSVLSLGSSGPATGGLGARGVLGTYLNVGLPLIGMFVELHPMYFFANSSFGIGGAIGVNIGF